MTYLSKFKLVSLVIVSITIIFTGIYFTFLKHNNNNITPLINAVPSDAGFVIETSDFKKFLKFFSKDNIFWKTLLEIPEFRTFNKEIIFVDSLTDNPRLKTIIKNKNVLISGHINGKDNINLIYILNIPVSEVSVSQKLFEVAINKKARITYRKYNDLKIYKAQFKEQNLGKTFHYAFYKDIFILTTSSILIEESYRQLSDGNSIGNLLGYKKVAVTAGKNVLANFYFNYNNFSRTVTRLMNDTCKSLSFQMANFGNWAEADIILKNNIFSLNGFTSVDEKESNYLSTFTKQKPVKINIENILPASTSAFLSFGIDDFNQYQKDYMKHLDFTGNLFNYNNALDKIKGEYKIDLEETFYSFLDNEFAIAFTELTNSDIKENSFAIFHTKSRDLAQEQMLRIMETYSNSTRAKLSSLVTLYKLNNESYAIYQSPIANIPQKLFGEFFSNTNPKYFLFIDDYLIFGSSVSNLTRFIHNIINQKTLADDVNYQEFANSISTRSNIYFYSNIAQSQRLISQYLNDDFNKIMVNNINTFKKFEAVALQFSSGKNLFYKNIFLKYNPVIKKENKTKWVVKLDNGITIRPQFIINHNTKNKEIFVQDLNNKIYLINLRGKIIWSRNLKEKIMSDIYQVDYLKNNKLQILFSTRNSIYLIDRNGKDAEKYPIKLPSPATNGVAVFDYEHNKDYRILIATDNKKVYCYKKNGELVKDWGFSHTDSKVLNEIQFINLKGEHYLLFSDRTKNYFLNRKGQNKITCTKNFVKSVNNEFTVDRDRIVATDTAGVIYFISINGKVESLKIRDFTSGHFFDYTDLNGDGEKEFIFVDENEIEVYKNDKTELFSKRFKGKISHKPLIYSFSEQNRKIGIVCGSNSEVFLLNSDGSEYKGFPLIGNSSFSIAAVNGSYNLIVAAEKNIIASYEIQ